MATAPHIDDFAKAANRYRARVFRWRAYRFDVNSPPEHGLPSFFVENPLFVKDRDDRELSDLEVFRQQEDHQREESPSASSSVSSGSSDPVTPVGRPIITIPPPTPKKLLPVTWIGGSPELRLKINFKKGGTTRTEVRYVARNPPVQAVPLPPLPVLRRSARLAAKPRVNYRV
jgi:hypothetical protein